MHRMTILYGRPEDSAAFDDYYRDVHLPIAQRMTGLTGWNLTWVSEQTGDFAPPVHLIVDLYAESREAMREILASEAGRAASADVPNFATGGVSFLEGAEDQVPTA